MIRGTKACSNDVGNITEMAVIPIMCLKLKKNCSVESKGQNDDR